MTLPSPTVGDFPTSGRTTPVIAFESSDALIQSVPEEVPVPER